MAPPARPRAAGRLHLALALGLLVAPGVLAGCTGGDDADQGAGRATPTSSDVAGGPLVAWSEGFCAASLDWYGALGSGAAGDEAAPELDDADALRSAGEETAAYGEAVAALGAAPDPVSGATADGYVTGLADAAAALDALADRLDAGELAPDGSGEQAELQAAIGNALAPLAQPLLEIIGAFPVPAEQSPCADLAALSGLPAESFGDAGDE
jgi:hypothetical protein